MSKYMNGPMNPASVTKPAEYKVWKGFYDTTFAPVNKAIMANGFIKVVKMATPADNGIDYKTITSEPGDVPK